MVWKIEYYDKDVPTDWTVTKVIEGKIGDYVAIARKDRNSDDWETNPNAFAYEERKVVLSDTLEVKMATSGGQAIHFEVLKN